MSNKKKQCDVYYDEKDKGHVYIEVNDLTDCCFEIWETEGVTTSKAKIKVPLKVWTEMLKRWTAANIKVENCYEYL